MMDNPEITPQRLQVENWIPHHTSSPRRQTLNLPAEHMEHGDLAADLDSPCSVDGVFDSFRGCLPRSRYSDPNIGIHAVIPKRRHSDVSGNLRYQQIQTPNRSIQVTCVGPRRDVEISCIPPSHPSKHPQEDYMYSKASAVVWPHSGLPRPSQPTIVESDTVRPSRSHSLHNGNIHIELQVNGSLTSSRNPGTPGNTGSRRSCQSSSSFRGIRMGISNSMNAAARQNLGQVRVQGSNLGQVRGEPRSPTQQYSNGWTPPMSGSSQSVCSGYSSRDSGFSSASSPRVSGSSLESALDFLRTEMVSSGQRW